MEAPVATSPYIPMFEVFRADLDEHHDRRERIVKASRDITANSKKIIFSLQRVRDFSSPLPASILSSTAPLHITCTKLLLSLVPDLMGMNAWRYQRQLSPGIQELLEAAFFAHYLQHQQLLNWDEAQARLPAEVPLTEGDWIGGVMDSVGECMRWGITGMAVQRKVPGKHEGGDGRRDLLGDLRELRVCLEGLDTQTSLSEKEMGKKMEVMRTCVEKVESAAYGMIIRGKERPDGWMPEERDEGMKDFE